MGSFEQVQGVGAIASKEFSMLKTMEKMEAEWSGLEFKVMPYKDTGGNTMTYRALGNHPSIAFTSLCYHAHMSFPVCNS